MTLLRTLRVASLCEGVSFLLLLVVAMPLKYLLGQPFAVTLVGWGHGVLFVVLGMLVLGAWGRGLISLRTAFLLGIASLLPAGPFFADRLLRQESGAR
jgi:integral membrane protein